MFAVWSARRSLSGTKRRELAETIADALERGTERIPEIAAASAGPLGDAATIARYLSDFTCRFGEPERRGYETFRALLNGKEPAPAAGKEELRSSC